MLKNNHRYYYEDKYMYFSFNGVHSSEYNLFMVNTGSLLSENSVEDTAEFVSSMHQEGAYYTGIKKTQKTFKRKCAAEGLSLSTYKKMMKWLTTGEQGFLFFDSDPYWGWDVVLTNVSDTSYVTSNNGLIVELELTFKTEGSYLAHNASSMLHTIKIPSTKFDNGGTKAQIQSTRECNGELASSSSSCNNSINNTMYGNSYGIPALWCLYGGNSGREHVYYLCTQPICNMYHVMNIFSTHIGSDSLTEDNVQLSLSYHNELVFRLSTLASADRQTTFDFYGDLHSVLINFEAAELHYPETTNLILSDNLLRLPCDEVKLISTVQYRGDNELVFGAVDEELMLNSNYNFICFVKRTDNPDNYSTVEWDNGYYADQYQTYFFLIRDGSLDLPDNPYILNLTEEDKVNSTMSFAKNDDAGTATVSNDEVPGDSSKMAAQTFSYILQTTDSTVFRGLDLTQCLCYVGRTNILKFTSNLPTHTIELISYNNI